MSQAAAAVPVAVAERVAALDVLRGAALFGVFLVNFTGLIGLPILSTGAVQAALPTAPIDAIAHSLIEWLFVDKANTLFAFLFGLGFWLQMQRLTARGAAFESIYRRRLAILLAFGLFHLVFVFTWDILHLYALCGFALLALRRSGDRLLLFGGLTLALFGRLVVDQAMGLSGLADRVGVTAIYGDAAAAHRQALAVAGDYPGLVRALLDFTWFDYLLGGSLVGWFLYALGRFMVGAWVGRRGWLQNSARHLPGFRRWARIALPLGLAGELAVQVVEQTAPDSDLTSAMTQALHMVAAPVLAAGYVCLIVSLLHGRRRGLLTPFAAVGRMALTNYVTQSLVIAFTYSAVGPGLGLAGRIGVAPVAAVVVAVFAVQVALSGWWLKRFNYGPMEWGWRALTYGERPVMRRV